MDGLARQAAMFRDEKDRFEREARQAGAFFIMSGIDLAAALGTQGQQRARVVARVARLIERERLKGARRHWGYDLNRHIALKQALDRLTV